MLIRIEAPHFVAGVVINAIYGKDNRPYNRCAPIIKYMKWWEFRKIINYCIMKNWEYKVHPYD